MIAVAAPFYPSDDEDDAILEDDQSFHWASGDGCSSQSRDFHDDTSELHHNPMSLENAEDFLEADDPALLDELEEQFLFD